jgi:hemerythrin-like domain-containing protein
MKRDRNLQSLSRQHHNGLLIVLLLSKGQQKQADIQVMARFILDMWNKELKGHFIAEESILVPALTQKSFNKQHTRRLLSEHEHIRDIVNKIEEGLFSPFYLNDFINTLERHIRFEERIYFPQVEKTLNSHELETVGQKLHESASVNCMDYPVKFWE